MLIIVNFGCTQHVRSGSIDYLFFWYQKDHRSYFRPEDAPFGNLLAVGTAFLCAHACLAVQGCPYVIKRFQLRTSLARIEFFACRIMQSMCIVKFLNSFYSMSVTCIFMLANEDEKTFFLRSDISVFNIYFYL